VAPHDPYDGNLVARLRPPCWFSAGSTEYLLGTDGLGRDVLSRLIYGARVSLVVGVVSTLVSMLAGVPLGLAAGYIGRAADAAISTAVNIMLTFPFILLALAVIAVLGNGAVKLIIVLGLAGWPVYARVVRAEVLRIRELEYVQAARSIGVPDGRIVFHHIVPNLMNAVIVLSTIQVGRVIISEAVLSFLGLGVTPPTPTWGNMLGESRTFMFDRWWLPSFPGLVIFLTTLAINLFGGALQEVKDPQPQ
jgi:ABC-type dipeptide/oligopeptide/nickel transport system permease subunit